MFNRIIFVLLLLFLFANMQLHAQHNREDITRMINEQVESLGDILPADTSSAHLLLNKMVADKTIVGIGEATHGTEEFLKAFMNIAIRLIRFNAFNIIIIAESEFCDTRALNDYVVHGKGDAITAFRYIRHFPEMKCEYSLLPLVEWVRAYNKTQTDDNKVWMLGAEDKGIQGIADDALQFIRQTNMPVTDSFKQTLSMLANLPLQMMSSYTLIHPLDELAPQFASFKTAALRYNGDPWLKQSINQIDRSLRTYYQLYNTDTTPSRTIVRDTGMYENIRWIKENRPGSKLVVYAHNAHIQKSLLRWKSYKYASFGYMLHQQYPGQYFTIATDAVKGTFNSGMDIGVVPISEDSNKFATLLRDATNRKNGILFFPGNEPLKKYFDKKHFLTVANQRVDHSLLVPTINITEDFDALYFTEISTPSAASPPWTSTSRFALSIPLSTDIKHDIQAKGYLELQVKSTLGYPDIPLPGTGACSILLMMDNNGKLVDIKAQVIDSSTMITRFILPAAIRSDNLFLSLQGNNMDIVQLNRIVVNQQEIPLEQVTFSNVDVFNHKSKIPYYSNSYTNNTMIIKRVSNAQP